MLVLCQGISIGQKMYKCVFKQARTFKKKMETRTGCIKSVCAPMTVYKQICYIMCPGFSGIDREK